MDRDGPQQSHFKVLPFEVVNDSEWRDEDLVYGEQDAPEVIPCMVYRRSSQAPFVMRFLEV